MSTEQELKQSNPLLKEFQNLLDKDFKDRKLKENEIIKATVSEITKNFNLYFFEINFAPVDFPVAAPPSQDTCIILFFFFKSSS